MVWKEVRATFWANLFPYYDVAFTSYYVTEISNDNAEFN